MLTNKRIKSILSMIGINIVSVKFDTDNRCIDAHFIYQGNAQQKIIPFADIEAVFSDAAGTHLSTPGRTENQPGG